MEKQIKVQQYNRNDEKYGFNKIVYKAMQIYEPWMEPGYYEKKEKKVTIKLEPEIIQEPVVIDRSVSVGLSGAGVKSRMLLTPVEDWNDEDSAEFVQWVMNGRLDDFGDVKKKLFKNEKDWC